MKYILLFCCLFCTLFLGCQKTSRPPLKQCLNLNIPSDPATMDPRKGGDVTSALFHFLLFEGLTRLDNAGNPQLALAEKIEISDDRKVYTFYLREAYWSDGSPITAWDFEKSWKDILQPDFPSLNAHLFYPIKNAEKAKLGKGPISDVGVKSINARMLEVSLENPTPYFLDLITFCVFFPVNSEVDHADPEWHLQSNKRFISSGPFSLKEWKRNNIIVLQKNPHYFKSDTVALEEIHLNIINNEMTSLQMFEKGELDILGHPLIPLPTDAIPALAKKGVLQISRAPATTFCSFNVDAFPLNNVHIRKALCYAIDRKEIVRNITQLQEEPALGMIPPILKKGKGKTQFYEDANLELARAHFKKGLEELHLTHEEFPRLKFLYTTSEEHHKIAQAIQQQWHQGLNIHVDLESADKKILLHLLRTRSYEIAQSFWMAQYNDSFNIFERFKHQENAKNYPNWENATYTDLLSRSCEAATEEERLQLLEQAEALFIEEMPLAPIFHWNSVYIKQPYVKSHGVEPIGNGFFEHVYIDMEAKKSYH